MTEEEIIQRAIEMRDGYKYNTQLYSYQTLKGLLDLYNKQNKMIDLMAEYLTSPIHDKQGVIDYFKKKVEEGK